MNANSSSMPDRETFGAPQCEQRPACRLWAAGTGAARPIPSLWDLTLGIGRFRAKMDDGMPQPRQNPFDHHECFFGKEAVHYIASRTWIPLSQSQPIWTLNSLSR